MTADQSTPVSSPAEARIEALLDAMTLAEQVSLLAGADFWTTVSIDRLGIPAIKVTDGPNGARGGGSLVGGVTAAAFPVGIALASTWNPALVEQVGQALAEEAQSKGALVLLGPTVNMHRSPLNGRNFECYSEDPYLSAQLAVAYISGVQSKGVGATVKHFVGNESEFERMTISSEIDERALREIYLPPFEAAVKQAHTWAVMASYNKLNGTYTSEHRGLLTDLLKEEWGFDGVVMSDWFGSHSTVGCAANGLDLEMPGPARHGGEKLVAAVQAGQVSPEAVRESARRVLRLLTRVGAFDDPTMAAEQAIDRPEHRALIRRAGAEGIVLLKNDDVLPLDKNATRKIAVIGPNAATAQIMGGGSAQVNAHYRISPLAGVIAQAGEDVEIGHEPGCSNYKLLPLATETFTVQYFATPDLSGEAVAEEQIRGGEVMWLGAAAPGVDPQNFSARLSARFTPDSDGEYRFGLTSAGLSRLFLNGALLVDNWRAWVAGDSYFGAGSQEAVASAHLRAGESYDLTVEFAGQTSNSLGIRAVRVGVTQPLGDAHIERAVQLAAQSDVALLFVGLNGEWDTEGQDRQHIRLVGRQDELIQRVAAVNPKTVVVLQSGGPIAMPWLGQVAGALQAWYPGQECGHAIADVLFGAVNPAGRLPQTFPVRLEDNPAYNNYPGENGQVRYGEGIFVGYRHYDEKLIEPLFPFGHGLSYTRFEYGKLAVTPDVSDGLEAVQVSFDVTNSGRRAGVEIAQVYLGLPAAAGEPPKRLAGWARVSLEPGETRRVAVTLDPQGPRRPLSFWDVATGDWQIAHGEYQVFVGASSRAIRLTGQLYVSGR